MVVVIVVVVVVVKFVGGARGGSDVLPPEEMLYWRWESNTEGGGAEFQVGGCSLGRLALYG